MKLGYVGVGKMGGPMAERLLAAGHELVVFDSRKEAIEPFVARGAKAAASVKALAGEVETVLVCLPSPEAVRSVAEEVIAARGSVRAFVDLSTTGPRVEAQVAELLRKAG